MTNGRVTEMEYLTQIKRHHGLKNTTVKVEFVGKDPRNLVDKLVSPNGDTRDYDQVWVVVDEDGDDLTNFLRRCENLSSPDQQWRAIVSRPSFEVWLIAHYTQVKKYRTQLEAQRHYAELVPDGTPEKSLPKDFPYDEVKSALARCHLRGVEVAPPNNLPPLPGTAMPHLIEGLAIDTPS